MGWLKWAGKNGLVNQDPERRGVCRRFCVNFIACLLLDPSIRYHG
jgi:hypothetical protein